MTLITEERLHAVYLLSLAIAVPALSLVFLSEAFPQLLPLRKELAVFPIAGVVTIASIIAILGSLYLFLTSRSSVAPSDSERATRKKMRVLGALVALFLGYAFVHGALTEKYPKQLYLVFALVAYSVILLAVCAIHYVSLKKMKAKLREAGAILGNEFKDIGSEWFEGRIAGNRVRIFHQAEPQMPRFVYSAFLTVPETIKEEKQFAIPLKRSFERQVGIVWAQKLGALKLASLTARGNELIACFNESVTADELAAALKTLAEFGQSKELLQASDFDPNVPGASN